MPVMKGMRIKTNSPVTKKARLVCRVYLDFLVIYHKIDVYQPDTSLADGLL